MRFALYSSQDDVDQVAKGMDEAFTKLDSLSSKDLGEDGDDGEASVDLKYSRTDDTQAGKTGKSTAEEIENYLEMQGELEGTASQEDLQVKQEELNEETVDDVLSQLDILMEQIGFTGEDEPFESINPILRLRGPVATGYGRGGKKLGVPTANLPSSLFQSALEQMNTGVYFGWAAVESAENVAGRNRPIKAVVNVGYSPTFEGEENKEKIVEAHLITESSPKDTSSVPESLQLQIDEDVDGDFYGETMRLQLIGFLRPEQKFDAFPDLIAQIHKDIGNAAWALDSMPYMFSKEDSFIKNGSEWVGRDGGDLTASWEYEAW